MILRRLRQSENGFSAGGLGGLILEGEPGLGKTELVIKTLVAHGLVKATPDNIGEHVFYHIPVSMPLAEKKLLLLKAFHEGAVVVIDEINSAPMIERLLNHLLMGQDEQGLPAKRPGFILIGTQNPVHMAGRRRASHAMAHRCQTLVVHEPHKNDMLNVLLQKGLPKEIAVEMIDEYLAVKTTKNLCFRDLVKAAKRHITASNRMESGKEEVDFSLIKHGLFTGEVPKRSSESRVSIEHRGK